MTGGGRLTLRRPALKGLFITGTDTGVGKTVVSCALAMCLRRAGLRVGVCKPFATGCRRDREGLVSEDAESLAHFADCRHPLEVINPVRYALPVAPAVAMEKSGRGWETSEIDHSLDLLASDSDVLVVEGVGGVMVPLDAHRPRVTVLDLAAALDYPVVVVTRATLGTLNHTALTVAMLRQAGCRVAGLVLNGYEPDEALAAEDPSRSDNRRWLERLTGQGVLAVVPRMKPAQVAVSEAMLPESIVEAVGMTYWPDVALVPRPGR